MALAVVVATLGADDEENNKDRREKRTESLVMADRTENSHICCESFPVTYEPTSLKSHLYSTAFQDTYASPLQFETFAILIFAMYQMENDNVKSSKHLGITKQFFFKKNILYLHTSLSLSFF